MSCGACSLEPVGLQDDRLGVLPLIGKGASCHAELVRRRSKTLRRLSRSLYTLFHSLDSFYPAAGHPSTRRNRAVAAESLKAIIEEFSEEG